MRALLVGLFAGAALGCSGESEGDTLCEPSSTIFCRCPAGDPGEKRCNEAGDAFGECSSCDDRPDAVGGGSPGTGGGNPDGLPLYRACSDGLECASGLCRYGYCTVACEKVSDCEYLVAECVSFGGSAVCMPTCETAIDCEPFDAPPSLCGYATAVDNWGVTVCANWGSEHALLPTDSDCAPFEHSDCNLGYSRRERVCAAEGLCKPGCFGAIDCPESASCSSNGETLGSCQ